LIQIFALGSKQRFFSAIACVSATQVSRVRSFWYIIESAYV